VAFWALPKSFSSGFRKREDGRTGGREEEAADGADTELKTKTPHVNVGNKS